MVEGRLTQADVARAAKVSQSTVSRVLSGGGLRRGAARTRLFTYADIQDASSSRVAGRVTVMDAFSRIWDGTPAHANAIAQVIDSLVHLRPPKLKRKTSR